MSSLREKVRRVLPQAEQLASGRDTFVWPSLCPHHGDRVSEHTALSGVIRPMPVPLQSPSTKLLGYEVLGGRLPKQGAHLAPLEAHACCLPDLSVHSSLWSTVPESWGMETDCKATCAVFLF